MTTPTMTRRRLAVFALMLGLVCAGVAAPANASTVLTILSSSSYVDSIDYRHVVGEVRNDGTTNTRFMQVNLTLHDAQGRLLSTESAYVQGDVLAPGQKAPFHAVLNEPAGYDHYKLRVSPSATTERGNRNFESTVTNEFTDSINYRHIVGTTRSLNTTRARFVELIFTFYNESGVVVAVETTYVKSSDDASLEPGASAPFELMIDSARSYTSYSYFANSSTAPSTGPTTQPSPSATPAQPQPTQPVPSPTQSTSPEQTPSLSIAPSVISAGQRTTVTYNGTPGAVLQVLSKTQPATGYSPIATVTLDSNGFGSTSHQPSRNTRIMARTASGIDSLQPLIQVRSVASLSARRISAGVFEFTGRVYPARVQRLVNIYRNGVLFGQARSDARGIYVLRQKAGVGTSNFQARTPNDTYNLGANSPSRIVRIY